MKKQSFREKICADMSISEAQLNRLIARAPHTYKVYTIPKKTGGSRVIAQPARETKYIQNWLITNVFSTLTVHNSASAYKMGASIKKNAMLHRKNSYLVKLDFKDFFTSIKSNDLIVFFRNELSDYFRDDDFSDIARICCIQHEGDDTLSLSIGAPSSPILSNLVMQYFDKSIQKWCDKNKVIYSRYADDLTFSSSIKGISSEIELFVLKLVESTTSPSLKINDKKTTHLSKKHQRYITGLVVTNEGNISLGRKRKRKISSLIHKYTLGILDHEDTQELQGLLGFAKDAEYIFFNSMKNKYGDNVVSNILKIRNNNEGM